MYEQATEKEIPEKEDCSILRGTPLVETPGSPLCYQHTMGTEDQSFWDYLPCGRDAMSFTLSDKPRKRPTHIRFAQVGDGDRFDFQGHRYTKKGTTGVSMKTGRTRFFSPNEMCKHKGCGL